MNNPEQSEDQNSITQDQPQVPDAQDLPSISESRRSISIIPTPAIAEADRASLYIEHRPSGTLNLSETAAQLGLSEEFLLDQSNHRMPYQDSSDGKRYFDLLSIGKYQVHIADLRKRVENAKRAEHRQTMDDIGAAIRHAQQSRAITTKKRKG